MDNTGAETVNKCFEQIDEPADSLEIQEMPLEETFGELDKLIEKMQAPDMSLEETFECYKKGLVLVQACNDKIEKVECDIKKVTGNE